MVSVEVIQKATGGETVLHRGVENRGIMERPPIVGIVGKHHLVVLKRQRVLAQRVTGEGAEVIGIVDEGIASDTHRSILLGTLHIPKAVLRHRTPVVGACRGGVDPDGGIEVLDGEDVVLEEDRILPYGHHPGRVDLGVYGQEMADHQEGGHPKS